MPNKELVKYIKKEQAQGYTPAQLKKVLVGEGWTEKDVDEAIKSANNKDTQPTPKEKLPKSSVKRPTSITVIAILYFIGGGITLLYSIYMLIMGSAPTMIMATIEQSSAVAALSTALTSILVTLISIIAIIGVIIGLFNLLVGWGLWTLKNWARILAIIQSIGIMITIIGIPIGVILLIFLIKKTTKQAFGK